MATAPKSPNLKVEEPTPTIGLIEGQIPDSDNEWFVSLALDKAIERADIVGYTYQYPLGGGREVRGGVVVDFVIYAPFAQALFVGAGGYWHGANRKTSDELAHALAAQYFGEANVLDFTEEETSSEELADKRVRKEW